MLCFISVIHTSSFLASLWMWYSLSSFISCWVSFRDSLNLWCVAVCNFHSGLILSNLHCVMSNYCLCSSHCDAFLRQIIFSAVYIRDFCWALRLVHLMLEVFSVNQNTVSWRCVTFLLYSAVICFFFLALLCMFRFGILITMIFPCIRFLPNKC